MSVKGYRVVDVSVYIFVQTHLQREGLTAIEYNNAEQRAEEWVKLFRNEFKISEDKIKVCRNWDKDQILSLCEEIYQDAKKFGQDHQNDTHSVYSVYFSWIGLRLDD